MKIEDRIAAIQVDIAAQTGLTTIATIEVRLADMGGPIARTVDGGDAIELDRAKAEAASDEDLRFIVNHELAHAYMLKDGIKRKETLTHVVADDAGPYNADVQG